MHSLTLIMQSGKRNVCPCQCGICVFFLFDNNFWGFECQNHIIMRHAVEEGSKVILTIWCPLKCTDHTTVHKPPAFSSLKNATVAAKIALASFRLAAECHNRYNTWLTAPCLFSFLPCFAYRYCDGGISVAKPSFHVRVFGTMISAITEVMEHK